MKEWLPNEFSVSPGKLTLLNLIGLQWKFGYLQSFGSFNFSESYFWGNLSTKVLTKYVYFWDCFLVALPLKGPLRNLNGALDWNLSRTRLLNSGSIFLPPAQPTVIPLCCALRSKERRDYLATDLLLMSLTQHPVYLPPAQGREGLFVNNLIQTIFNK